MPVEFQKKLVTITYNEVQRLYGLKPAAANRCITIIRTALGKRKDEKLTVIDFCKVEGMTLDEFDILWSRANS